MKIYFTFRENEQELLFQIKMYVEGEETFATFIYHVALA